MVFNISGTSKSLQNSSQILQAVPRVFPVHTDWSIMRTWQKKKDSVAEFKALWNPFFYGRWGFHIINKVTQSTLAALFVNGLSPKISGLIKRQKIRREARSLTELLTVAEQLGPWSSIANKICQAINFIAKQFQGQRPQTTPGPPVLHPPGPITKMLVHRLMSQL